MKHSSQILGTLGQALSLVTLILVNGCTNPVPYKQKKPRMVYFHPVRQIAPEPVYNRIAYVRPPDSLPYMDPVLHAAIKRKDLPKIQIHLRNALLEDAAKVLAESLGYGYYCASSIATREINFTGLGTVEELAKDLSDKEGVKVIIDHSNNEVRLLGAGETTVKR